MKYGSPPTIFNSFYDLRICFSPFFLSFSLLATSISSSKLFGFENHQKKIIFPHHLNLFLFIYVLNSFFYFFFFFEGCDEEEKLEIDGAKVK